MRNSQEEGFTEEENINDSIVYVVTETYEGDDGIREFSIKLITRNQGKAKKLIKDLYEKDEYSYFSKNGTEVNSDTLIRSNFDCGFVEYCVSVIKLEKIE